MSEQPTPETDDQPTINAINDDGYAVPCVDIEFARKLERERDEAREKLRTAVQERHDFHWELQDAIRERNEAREELRAMARKALEGWK